MTDYQKRVELLNSTTTDELFPLFVPSYRRPDFAFASRILKWFSEEALQKVFIAVREEQYDQYAKTNPQLQYLVIPEGTVSGCGSTRNFIMKTAADAGIPHIFDFDDDINNLTFLWHDVSGKGEFMSKHSGNTHRDEIPFLYQKILQLASRIAREAFERHPDLLLGNLRRQRFSQGVENAAIKYQIFAGSTPRQTKILNVDNIREGDVYIPDEYNIHGEDVGYTGTVLAKGYGCFNIPCLTYDFVSEQIDSTVRDPHDIEKNRPLHRKEWNDLGSLPMRDNYFRVSKRYDDGEYMFGDVSFPKYCKFTNKEPIYEYW